MDGSVLESYVNRLARYKPRFIRGYTSALHVLAKYMEANDVAVIRPEAVFTTSETLFDHQRESIERQFRCPVFDHYGSGEIHSVAFECEAHSGYHITAENVIVEIVKGDGSPAAPGERGELVLTDLNNYATPFIRYNIEDIGAPAAGLCPCGRGLPLMKTIEGRSSEILEMPNGRFVFIGYWVVLFETLEGIDQFQVIQESTNRLVIKVVKNKRFSAAGERHIVENIRRLGGNSLALELQFVESIAPTDSGKRRFVVSDVERRRRLSGG
jgi:phenylacetate-CoA ligase